MTMLTKYSCDLCKQVFNQKNDLIKHKTSCNKIDNKIILINVFKNCLNIMRDNEGLTGEKALRNLSYFLILKLLEPHFDGDINIDN